MSWAPVSTPVIGQGRFHSLLTLNVDPTPGDVLVLGIVGDASTEPQNLAIGGTAVTEWKQFEDGTTSPFGINTANGNLCLFLLWGVAVGGPTTVTVSTFNNGCAAFVQEFIPPASFSEDTVYGPDSGNADSGNYAPIDPTNVDSLYVAIYGSRDPAAPTGSTPGFTYSDFYATFIGGCQFVYDEAASVTQSPAWANGTGSPADFATFGAFLTTPSPTNPMRLLL